MKFKQICQSHEQHTFLAITEDGDLAVIDLVGDGDVAEVELVKLVVYESPLDDPEPRSERE